MTPAARPLMLETEAGPCPAWWHGSGRPASAVLVLCSAWGDEDLSAYRGQRALAQALADAGWPVLRFDWPGQGDAFDGPLAGPADAVPLWLQALHLAVDRARALAGGAPAVLCGLRLGALLAAQVAAQRADLAGLVVLQPVGSGRTWLREAALLGARVHSVGEAGAASLGGFQLNPASAAHVRALTWPAPQSSGLPALLLGSDTLPPPGALQQQLASHHALQTSLLPDLERLTAVAHDAHWPPELATRIGAWLATLPGAPCPPAPLPASEAVACAEGVRERCLQLPGQPPCVAVLSEAEAGVNTAAPGGQRALLLLSSGAERRAGPHRLWVDFARQRARRGELVLRLDLPGVGDSPSREAGVPDDLYDPRVQDDLRGVIDWLRREHGVQQLSAAGLCSGGHHLWRAAVQGQALDRVLVINPLVYHWRAGMSLNPLNHGFGQIAVARDVGRSLGDPKRWRRLLRGESNLPVIRQALQARALATLGRPLKAVARGLRWPLREDLVQDLQRVRRGRCQLHFVFAQGEPGLALLREQAGRAAPAETHHGNVHLHTIADADHTFAGVPGRQRLYKQLHAVLDQQDAP